MKKITFQILVVAALFVVLPISSQNLLEGLWDGNGITGVGSEPNTVGWDSPEAGVIPWAVANNTGGCRFRDDTPGYTYEDGGAAVTGRHMMVRWDAASYVNSYYAYPVTLAASTDYKFELDFVMGGSATPPKDIRIGASTTIDGTGLLADSLHSSTSNTTQFRHGACDFTTTTAGTYYVTLLNGTVGVNSWWGIINLSVTVDLGTGVQAVENNLKVLVQGQAISVPGVNSYEVYNLQGMKVAEVLNNAAGVQTPLNKGIYVVKSESLIQKVFVQ